jgi:hypothetical protein
VLLCLLSRLSPDRWCSRRRPRCWPRSRRSPRVLCWLVRLLVARGVFRLAVLGLASVGVLPLCRLAARPFPPVLFCPRRSCACRRWPRPCCWPALCRVLLAPAGAGLCPCARSPARVLLAVVPRSRPSLCRLSSPRWRPGGRSGPCWPPPALCRSLGCSRGPWRASALPLSGRSVPRARAGRRARGRFASWPLCVSPRPPCGRRACSSPCGCARFGSACRVLVGTLSR